jgi:cell division protein ZapE
MDLFYDSVQSKHKRRVHFHRFMKDVHQQLAQHQGESDPLIAIANQVADEITVLCFDEFFVNDIGDAMLLSGLIRQLFKRNVTIVATSNVEPAQLYKNGLQRQRFMPAIEAIEANMLVVHMDGLVDHRLRRLDQCQAYFLLSDTDSRQLMFERFEVACKGQYTADTSITVEHRLVSCLFDADSALWFDFEQICKGARSQNDYIALANRYGTMFVSDVPQMGGQINQRNIAQGTEDAVNGSELAKLNRQRQDILQCESKSDDEARRFIALVDELYDCKVKLYISAAVPITQLYLGGRLTFEFERAVSRLLEMQSVAYFDACEQRLNLTS